MFVKIAEDGTKTYPYDLLRLRMDNPSVSFAEEPDDATLAEFGVFPVETVQVPVASAEQRIEEREPELIGGAWRQTFVLAGAHGANP